MSICTPWLQTYDVSQHHSTELLVDCQRAVLYCIAAELCKPASAITVKIMSYRELKPGSLIYTSLHASAQQGLHTLVAHMPAGVYRIEQPPTCIGVPGVSAVFSQRLTD